MLRLDGVPLACSDLSGLGLSGQLPLDARIWGALPNVTTVNLSNNSIQGYVPPQLDRLKAAQNLNVRDNGLQGPLPDLAGLGHLQNIHLDNNQMTGGPLCMLSHESHSELEHPLLLGLWVQRVEDFCTSAAIHHCPNHFGLATASIRQHSPACVCDPQFSSTLLVA